jgi:hypothetical protein
MGFFSTAIIYENACKEKSKPGDAIFRSSLTMYIFWFTMVREVFYFLEVEQCLSLLVTSLLKAISCRQYGFKFKHFITGHPAKISDPV